MSRQSLVVRVAKNGAEVAGSGTAAGPTQSQVSLGTRLPTRACSAASARAIEMSRGCRATARMGRGLSRSDNADAPTRCKQGLGGHPGPDGAFNTELRVDVGQFRIALQS
jgi:hypothetical protein